MFAQTQIILEQIKNERPLVLNITNYVTMDFIANGLLSLGASPIMSHAEEEIKDLLKYTKIVVINLGTLHASFIALCKRTCQLANEMNIPIVLDPVGVGASQYRTHTCTALINEFQFAIIRGNASEITALAGSATHSKGVDSVLESHDAIQQAKVLSKQYQSTMVISGKTDYIVDNDSITQFDSGSALMPSITGMGCLLTAIIAAFHAVEKNRVMAASTASLFFGMCGEIAEKKSQGPGSFKMNFLDALSFFPERELYENR